MKRDLAYLRHMADAAAKIERYTRGLSREAFEQDDMVIDAVLRELEVIGEAARNLSELFRSGHPELPVAEMVGMRNRLIHVYFGVDLDIVWQTCKSDLQALRSTLEALIEKEDGEPGDRKRAA